LGVAIWTQLALAVVRQKEEPMPQGRQLGTREGQGIIAVKRGAQGTQRCWRDEVFQGFSAALPGLQMREHFRG
jgi:hypothetical protein